MQAVRPHPAQPSDFFSQLAALLPRLLGALVLLALGWIAALAYWLVILITSALVASSLSLPMMAELLNRMTLFVPKLVTALFVLILGILAARLVNRVLFAFLHGIRFRAALTASTLAELAITVFTVFLALEQSLIDKVVLYALFQIGFGTLCLALAIGFGLGGREQSGKIIDKLTRLGESHSRSSRT